MFANFFLFCFKPLPLKEEEETIGARGLLLQSGSFNPLPLKEEEETAA
ncbi:hypothetical protein LEP1GSC198_1421 [Leptospira kirschneri str. JB]|nr:hypothetical protein LEP1GSC198_1421 [Leptospira kirschneri str. JB]